MILGLVPMADLAFDVPWVEGPRGYSRPFGIDSKYGHVVFAFASGDEEYNTFFEFAKANLRPEFSLRAVLVIVSRPESLSAELDKYMPTGQTYKVVTSGTADFIKYIEDLKADTFGFD